MTEKRPGVYVWITWLSKLMSGEVRCQWAPWFRSNFTGYSKTPSDFQLATWTIEHTQLLNELIKERSKLGEGIYKEEQNRFKVTRSSGLVLAGKPDLITINADGHCTVYDAKTGIHRQSDIVQVMLYMMSLPFVLGMYKGKQFTGCVVYKDGTRSDIPARAVDKVFQEQVTYFLNILESENPPERSPSSTECRFCDITAVDCPTREEVEDDDVSQDEEPEIPV